MSSRKRASKKSYKRPKRSRNFGGIIRLDQMKGRSIAELARALGKKLVCVGGRIVAFQIQMEKGEKKGLKHGQLGLVMKDAMSSPAIAQLNLIPGVLINYKMWDGNHEELRRYTSKENGDKCKGGVVTDGRVEGEALYAG